MPPDHKTPSAIAIGAGAAMTLLGLPILGLAVLAVSTMAYYSGGRQHA